MIAGVILAGGLSTRMGGGDKFLRSLAGRPILDHVIERIAPQVDQLALNANGDAARLLGIGLPVVADTIDGFAGPLAGVLAGMDWAAGQGADTLISVAADTPFFPTDLCVKLQDGAMADNLPLAMAVTPEDGRMARHPTFGLWSVALREDLRHALQTGVRKVVAWTEPHGCAKVPFDNAVFDPFFNVNTPDDLQRAQSLFQEHFT